jgi:methyltransferase (TIGR00027 family)
MTTIEAQVIAMESKPPSRTALIAAAYRAAHQKLEGGKIFADPLARIILGNEGLAVVDEAEAGRSRPIRLFIAARSRFAEDCLSAAVSRGVRQAIILGAGMDTFSLRNPHTHLGLRVFEVDHPATQTWKRERLMQVGLTPPRTLIFAPVDFERHDLADGLRAAGFQSDQPAYFHWLGVVPYLTREAISATLDFIAGVPKAEVVFDYFEPLENAAPERRAKLAEIAGRAAAIGEPWISYFDPVELSRNMRARGFEEPEDLGLADILVRFLGASKDQATGGPGPHIMRARRAA